MSWQLQHGYLDTSGRIRRVTVDNDAEHAVDAVSFTIEPDADAQVIDTGQDDAIPYQRDTTTWATASFTMTVTTPEAIAMLFGVPVEMLESDPLAELLEAAGIHARSPDAADIARLQRSAEAINRASRPNLIDSYRPRPRP